MEKDAEESLGRVSSFQGLGSWQTFVITWDKDLAPSLPMMSR
jgi:hypothetical protein